MTISPTDVSFDEHKMWVALSDGRTIGVPLAWFPRLLNATAQERQEVELSRLGLHWGHILTKISPSQGSFPAEAISVVPTANRY